MIHQKSPEGARIGNMHGMGPRNIAMQLELARIAVQNLEVAEKERPQEREMLVQENKLESE